MTREIICCCCGEPIEGDVTYAEGDNEYCQDCADAELEECAFCGDLRWPENLFEYKNSIRKSQWDGKKMCVGCLEKADDEDYENGVDE